MGLLGIIKHQGISESFLGSALVFPWEDICVGIYNKGG